MGGAGAISRAGQVAIRKEQSSILLALTIALESVLERDGIDADADFFDELEADSLLIAQLCARLRSVPGLPPVAIKDVYQNPTAARLADHLEHQIAIAQTSHSDNRAGQRDTDGPRTTLHSSAAPASTASYWLCGALQLATFIVTALALSLTLSFGYEWVANGSGAVQTYLRAIIVGSGHFVGLALFPVALKWTLVGRFKVETIPIWSLRYFRFWLVKTALRANPVVLFAGTPVFPVYLRLLGARIGEGAVIFSRGMPVCTDLISIGSGAVIRRSAVFSGYRATGSVIQTGTVRIGDNAFVGEATVLEIDSEVGDGAQLGHSSSLGVGQSIPAGQRRVGVPATTDSDVDYMAVEAGLASTLRRFGYGLLQLSFHLLVTLPLPTVAFGALADWRWAMSETDSFLGISAGFDLVSVLILSGLVFVTLMVVRLALAVAAGRVLSVFVRPNTTYSLYGLHYMAQRGIERFTNSKFWTWLLGDTSYIVHYLKLIGYDVSFEKQTGSNFGTSVVHENPYYVSVGPGTMAADGFYALNNDYSSTSFRVNEVRVGSDSFFGNNIFYPSHSTVGDNCLLASKTVVPTSGERRDGVGFLGSPAFEIPRSVFRDQEFAELRESEQFPRLLRAKNRSNIASMILGLSHRYLLTTTVVAVAVGAIDAFDALGPLGFFATAIATAIVAPVYLAVAERASIGFRDLEPMHCSIYDRRSWRIERFWKLSSQPAVFNGTPFKSVMWRLYGVRVGKRLFDDGCAIIEKTMVTIGDDCVFNAGSLIQPHSQEDGSFKSDDIVIGSGVTLGVGSLVHYGVTMGDGATLDAASFLMKGSDVVPGSHWGENPSRELEALIHIDQGAELVSTTTDATTTTNAPIETLDSRRYWHDVLMSGGFTPLPRWTIDLTDRVADTSVGIDTELMARVRDLSERFNTSVTAVLLAAHTHVVASLTGERDVVMGLIPDDEVQVALPCHLSIGGDKTFGELVGDAASVAADATRHAGFDLGALRSDLNLETPLFETVVGSLDNTGSLPDAVWLGVGVYGGIAGSHLRVRHHTSHFSAEYATRIAGYHVRALRLLCDDPGQ